MPRTLKDDPFFRRPKTYKEISDANIKMAVKRAVDAGHVKQVKLNLYFVDGWWNKLPAGRWTIRDAMLYLTLGLGKRFTEGTRETLPKNVDTDIDLLRREIKFFRLISNVTNGIADELERRAGLLASIEEDSETEVVD